MIFILWTGNIIKDFSAVLYLLLIHFPIDSQVLSSFLCPLSMLSLSSHSPSFHAFLNDCILQI